MSTASPHISFIYDRYKKASSKRKASIELRISYDRKQKYLSTGLSVFPKQWREGRVVNTPDCQQQNQMLEKLLTDVRQILMDMQEEGFIDIFSVPQRLEEKRNGGISLYDFIRKRSEVRVYGKSKDTRRRYERFLRLFREWGGINSFRDITEANIIAYDEYLKAKGMKDNSKWNNYHRFLNSFIRDAIDAGLIKRNPYKWLSINKEKDVNGLQRCLNPEEFGRIMGAKMPTECLEKVRDVFVFQTYTCLSYTDLKDFDTEKITTIRGMKVYIGKRDKTGKSFTIPLLSKALVILRKYDGRLPVISNVKYNLYLKAVAQASGINRPISTHWARHTGATMLLNEGVPMQIVSKICGHSSIKMTEKVYAKLLDETVVEAVRKLKDKK